MVFFYFSDDEPRRGCISQVLRISRRCTALRSLAHRSSTQHNPDADHSWSACCAGAVDPPTGLTGADRLSLAPVVQLYAPRYLLPPHAGGLAVLEARAQHGCERLWGEIRTSPRRDGDAELDFSRPAGE